MELSEYFDNRRGICILSTADGDGRLNTDIYSRPHFFEDGTVAFIMRDRLSHANLQSNPFVSYLYIEEGEKYRGKRLYLQKVGEEKETERLYKLRRRKYPSDDDPENDPKFLVFFTVEKVRPLLGNEAKT